MKKILFFTPYGTLTGSEVLLWNFLNHFDRHKLQAALYCEQNGQLISSIPTDIPFFISPFRKKGIVGYPNKVLKHSRLLSQEQAIIKIHNTVKPDCWYLNTVLMFYLTPIAKKLGVKIIAHINELNSAYELVSYEDMSLTINQADIVVGITKHICDLASVMGAKYVVQQNCFVDLTKQNIDFSYSKNLMNNLNICKSDFIWLIIGTPTYRKGFDFITSVSKHFKHKNCHFIWMGYTQTTGLSYLVEKQLEFHNIRNVSLIASQTEDYYNYIYSSNALLLPSREEPFGNVIIDAASLGKPIVASVEGGAAEFIKPGMGELVQYSTAENFIQAMEYTMANYSKYNSKLLIEQSKEYSTESQVVNWQEKILEAWK